MPIIPATRADIPALIELLDSGYRGEESKKGWTSEADMIDGDKRTDDANLTEMMALPGAIFFKSLNETGQIDGCVFLQVNPNKEMYLGMLCVTPLLQAKGLGKQLMQAAEAYATQNKCTRIYMRVVSLRNELIAWYERQGYKKTTITEPFPVGRFGNPLQPLEFIIMDKYIDQ